MASQIARGDIDPTTLKPMIDILPSYQPRSKDTPLRVLDSNRPQNRSVTAQASILQYFRKLIINLFPYLFTKHATEKQMTTPKQDAHLVHKLPLQTCSVGKTSGKRTLIEEYERETSAKRCKSGLVQSADRNKRSKFFGNTACFSPVVFDNNKENSKELAADGNKNRDYNSLEEDVDFVESKGHSLIHNNDLERDSILELSSPLQRIAVSPCSIPVQSQKATITVTLEEDVLEDRAFSPNSSDGRITSPPSSSKSSMGKKSRKTGAFTDQNHDVFTVDLKGSFSEEHTPVQSPARRDHLDAIAGDEDDEIEEDFQTRHRLVAKGWERRFSRYTSVNYSNPCQVSLTNMVGLFLSLILSSAYSVRRLFETNLI